MRALLVILIVYPTLVLVPFRPFLGMLLFSWLAYMRPHNIAFGLESTRMSFHVAMVTLIGLAIAVALGRERFLVLKPQTVLLIALGIWIPITGFTAVRPELSEFWVELFVKVILMSVITTGLVSSRDRYRALIILIAFSLGLLGLKYGLFSLMRGGVRFFEGPGGFMSKNNPFALSLVMAVPLLAAVAATEHHRILKFVSFLLLPFVILTIFFTFSRGGLLALAVVAAMLLLHFRKPIVTAATLALVASILLLFTSPSYRESYFERANTIATYEEDGSAMGRVAAWKTALRISRDYPVFGVGPRNFQTVYSHYALPGEVVRVAHNSFLQLLAEDGVPALVIYTVLLIVSLWRLQRLRMKVSSQWIRTHARMLQISIAGYVTGGFFLDMAYFDLYYHLIALGVALEVIASVEAAGEEKDTAQTRSLELPWWKRARQAEA
jgi:probable O-glycosylation ligase (exosortase A-associated)